MSVIHVSSIYNLWETLHEVLKKVAGNREQEHGKLDGLSRVASCSDDNSWRVHLRWETATNQSRYSLLTWFKGKKLWSVKNIWTHFCPLAVFFSLACMSTTPFSIFFLQTYCSTNNCICFLSHVSHFRPASFRSHLLRLNLDIS